MTQTKTISDAGSTPAGSTTLGIKMVLIFTFLLIAGLEIAQAGDEPISEPVPIEVPEEPDMCVGCDDEKEEESPPPQLTVEIQIDPVTGEIRYIIKGFIIEY